MFIKQNIDISGNCTTIYEDETINGITYFNNTTYSTSSSTWVFIINIKIVISKSVFIG